MLAALDRKLARDLLHMKGQVLAIALVMACGIATFVMSMSALQSLEQTLDAYYEQYRFAQVFASLKRAPNTVRARLEAIPGVARVDTRIERPVTLDIVGFSEPIAGRLISVDDDQPRSLNTLYLRRGRWLDPLHLNEALISDRFAEAHGLQPGDSITAIINGRLDRLLIVGMVLSPEFVYSIREGELLPDEKRFGVLWMNERQLRAAFNMDGAFNAVAATLEHGANENDVISQLDRILEPYGSIGAYGRDDHPSHKFVANEMRELRSMAVVAPSIFLTVAAFLLNIVISRLISTQREQIAMLKAIGYSRSAIARHYLMLVAVIGVIGAVLGVVSGAWLGQNLTELYTRFFQFPVFGFTLNWKAVALAMGGSIAAAVLGAVMAVARAVTLPAAEAMRPERPPVYRRTIFERLGLSHLITPAESMVVRHLERQPVRSALSCAGMALAVAVLVIGSYVKDAIEYVMAHQFELSQRQHLMIGFAEPTQGDVMQDVGHLPGVRYVEPFRSLPVRLRAEHRSRRVGVLAMRSNPELYQLFDEANTPVFIPECGIVLSKKLAEILHVRTGDHVIMEVLESERPVLTVTVSRTVPEYTGVSAYMHIDEVNRLMRQDRVASGACVAAERAAIPSLYSALKETPHVATVSVKAATLESFRNTIADNLMLMRTFNVIFACVIAFGVIYNSARIALSERGRELATLRVVGFTRGEVASILLGELAIIVLCAIPIGLVLGYTLAAWTTTAFDTELFRIPLVIHPSTYGFAALVAICAALVSGLTVQRRLNRLDLIVVLKTRE